MVAFIDVAHSLLFLSIPLFTGAMPGSYYSDIERTIYLTYVILQADVAKYNELFQAERKFISFEYWNEHFVHQLDFDDLVYGHEKLSEIVVKYPKTKDGLTRFLYEIILRRMEIRDKSRSVNSVDIVFNFDCIGFTGTVRFVQRMDTIFGKSLVPSLTHSNCFLPAIS